MLKLLKYLKKSILPILAIVALLVVQAICDLTLPDFTSNIVNVGIQQSGIESAAPSVIRSSELEKIKLFLLPQDAELVDRSYKQLDQSSMSEKEYQDALKSYPKLAEEPLAKLDTKDKETLNELEAKMARAMLLVSYISGDSEEAKAIQGQILSQLPPEIAAQNPDVMQLFASMPQEQLTQVVEEMNNQLSAMPDSIAEQSAISYVKSEYQAICIDVNHKQTMYILFAGAKMLGIALLSMASTIVVCFLAARVAAALGQELRSRIFRKVVSFSNTEFDKFSTASLITRSTNDIQQIQMLMVMLLRIVFYAPIIGVGGVIKVIGTDSSMSWIIAVAVVAILTLVLILFSFAMPKFKKMQKLVDRVNLVAREILTGLPVIRAFSTQKHEEERFDVANKNLTRTNLFVNRTMALMMPAMMLVMNGISVLIVWNGSHAVDAGTMQVGNMMAFIQYTMQIIMAFLMISMISVMLPRASVSATRIEEVLKTDLVIHDPVQPQPLDTAKRGYVEFKNVSFRYPNAEGYVLSDISFTAKPGETTAFIGSTGSGKSTLINLIPRFFDATQGEILVDGVDVRNVSQHELRSKIGYVPQKGVLFSGTIESNLKYGNQDIPEEQMKAAAQVAQAASFIEEKPEQYETEIAQGGGNVSGGQKQRLSIARAIAINPEIYIFDDSFSALDFKTDSALRKALKEHTADSTVLIVAQRISTILQAEQIIVLDEGRVVGKGTHKELLKTCDVYRQIALSQLSKEELADE